MEAKKNRHIVAKVILVIGLGDALLALVLWVVAGIPQPSVFIRAPLWIGLPLLFIFEVFGRKSK